MATIGPFQLLFDNATDAQVVIEATGPIAASRAGQDQSPTLAAAQLAVLRPGELRRVLRRTSQPSVL